MRKFALMASVLSIVGAFAPVAANADVGTSMYQPGPIIVHAPASKATVQNAKLAGGRTAHAGQLKAIQHNRVAV